MSGTFYNPYNFIPAPARGERGSLLPGADGDTPGPDGLRDGPPAGHHRWHDELWSGDIAITIRTVTPLLLTRERRDPPRAGGEHPDHRHLEVATITGADGVERVDLAPTQIKGMLRGLYEAVTCSRFGVFERRGRLGYRADVGSAANLRPALVVAPAEVHLLGDLALGDVCAAAAVTVEAWQRAGTSRTWLLPGLAHGDQVEAVIVLDEFTIERRGRVLTVRRWLAEAVRPIGGEFIPCRQLSGKPRHLVRGLLHATGPTIEGKHAERIFVTEVLDGRKGLSQRPPKIIRGPGARELVSMLVALKDHQRDIHRSATDDEIWDRQDRAGNRRKPWEYFDHEPGKTAWARHLYDAAGRTDAPDWTGRDFAVPAGPHEPSLTCWAEPGNDNRPRPVMVSRLLHDHDQAELLPASAHPATCIEHLSPADRVFGWVAPERAELGAHRGQLRVVEVQAPLASDAVERLDPPLTIEPLSMPKPSQGRFYVGKVASDGRVTRLPTDVKKQDFFQPGNHILRGRKVYPHQQGLVGRSTSEICDRLRYVPPSDRSDKIRDSQNATLHGWVRTGAVFRAVLRVENLNDLELGALLWLLDPTRLGHPARPGRWKLGGGKPLGFGSVEIAIDTGGTALALGTEIAGRLGALRPWTDSGAWGGLAEGFEQAITERFSEVIDAVRHAASGYPADVDVHYPRPGPGAHGYDWFVLNERVSGRRLALPLLGEPPLPKYPAEPNQRGRR